MARAVNEDPNFYKIAYAFQLDRKKGEGPEKAMETIKKLVEEGANINARSRYNITPLMIAVLEKQFDIARFLLDLGADPELKDDRGTSVISSLKRNLKWYEDNGTPPPEGYKEFYEEIMRRRREGMRTFAMGSRLPIDVVRYKIAEFAYGPKTKKAGRKLRVRKTNRRKTLRRK